MSCPLRLVTGDPFTVMNAYDEWIRVKAARRESSRRWCRRKGLQEQRLYEITKLRRQFEDILRSSGLPWLGAAAQHARRRGNARRRGTSRASMDALRKLKMRREGRKRKVLQIDQAKTEGEGEGSDDSHEALRELMGETRTLEGDVVADSVDLSSLEFYSAQDVGEWGRAVALWRRNCGTRSAMGSPLVVEHGFRCCRRSRYCRRRSSTLKEPSRHPSWVLRLIQRASIQSCAPVERGFC